MRQPLIATLLLHMLLVPQIALAQSEKPGIDDRVNKLEREMRAVQRKIFPGGDPRFFEPEITPPTPSADMAAGTPATTPIADLTARVGALEGALQQLTGQVEQQGFRLKQLEEAVTRMRGDTDYRLGLLEGGGSKAVAPTTSAPTASSAPTAMPAATGTAPPSASRATGAAPPATRTVISSPAAAPTASTSRPAPATGDPAEDAYITAYRLWADKNYAEAQIALRDVVAKYPKHRRASFAQNLLGRAYLADGKPAAAAEAFYANYQKMPRGERAAESLFNLGQTLVQLKKPKDACRVFDELNDVYGATLDAGLKTRVTKARADAKCTS